MKLSSKLIIFSVCMCAFAFSLLVFSWARLSDEKPPQNFPNAPTHREEQKLAPVENNISPSAGVKRIRTEYLLVLEDDTICAYILNPDGTRFLWNSMKLAPGLSGVETESLRKGMPVENFEEMCLYFESYVS